MIGSKACSHEGRLFDEATQWLLAEEPAWPYSFESICAVLDLDANAVRRAVGLPGQQSAPALRQVKKATRNHEGLKHVNGAKENCVARLTGTVPTGMQRLKAAVVTRSRLGGCPAQGDLRVTD